MHTNGITLAPSLLAADFTQLKNQMLELADAGINTLHIDVMDGRFVPNITFGALVVRALRPLVDFHFDVHLMIVEPEKYIKDFVDAGANTITVHYEASPHLYRTLQQIHDSGCRAGVAINPHTHEMVLRDVMGLVDIINVMTVNPGFGGQSFLDTMMPKIANLRAMVGDIQRDIDIEVDGGINAETASSAVQAGANWLVAGTAVFGHAEGIQAGVNALHNALNAE